MTGHETMKILVPIDGSPASLRALDHAIDQAKTHSDTSLVVVNVQNLATVGLAEAAALLPSALINQEEDDAASAGLQKAEAICHSAGVTCVTRARRGAIAEAINSVAREEHVAHIVMGTRGLGSVRGMLLGSVATRLLHLVDVPVTLVK
jgi:nucleotide-binding universal stress UspA family protein